MPKKVKNVKNIFLFKTNIKLWRMFLHELFNDFKQNIVFKSVTLVIKKFSAIFDFFTYHGLFTKLCPTLCIKKHWKIL